MDKFITDSLKETEEWYLKNIGVDNSEIQLYDKFKQFLKSKLQEAYERGCESGELEGDEIGDFKQQLIEKIEKFGEDIGCEKNPRWVKNQIMNIIKEN